MNQILGTFPQGTRPRIVVTQDNEFVCPEDLLDGRPNWERLAQRYGTGPGKIYIGFDSTGKPQGVPWQEILLGMRAPCIDAETISIVAQPLDSYTVQAQLRFQSKARRTKLLHENDVRDAGVQVLLVKDGEFLLSVRAGSDQPGVFDTSAAGAVGYTRKADPFAAAAVQEVYEEANTRVENLSLHGVFQQNGNHLNTLFVYSGEPTHSLQKIIAQHKRGRELYESTLRNGTEAEARRVLEHDPDVPSDAWESQELIAFPFNRETVECLMSAGSHVYNGKAIPFIGSLSTTLRIVQESYGGELRNIPSRDTTAHVA